MKFLRVKLPIGPRKRRMYAAWLIGYDAYIVLLWMNHGLYNNINQSVFHGIPVWLTALRSTAKLNIMTTSWYFLMWFARESIHCTYPRIGFWFLRTDPSESLITVFRAQQPWFPADFSRNPAGFHDCWSKHDFFVGWTIMGWWNSTT